MGRTGGGKKVVLWRIKGTRHGASPGRKKTCGARKMVRGKTPLLHE